MKKMIIKAISLFLLITLSNYRLQAQHKDVKVIAYFSGNVSQLDSFDVNKINHCLFISVNQ
ncbi:MAG: hypothetical protein ABIR81_04080 [Ginsengibacter sp.]